MHELADIPGHPHPELKFSTREMNRRRYDVKTGHDRQCDGIRRRPSTDQKVVYRRPVFTFLNIEASARIALCINVDQQNAHFVGGKRDCQIHSRGGFPNTTLLVGNRDNTRQLLKAAIMGEFSSVIRRVNTGERLHFKITPSGLE